MLKRSLFTVLLVAAGTSSAFAATVRLDARTPVSMHVTSVVSSRTAHVGDTVKLAVAEDVIVDGYVLIARGAEGKGTVDAVQPAQMDGVQGQLRVSYKWVRAVDGSKIRVDGGFIGNGPQATDTTGRQLTNLQQTAHDQGATGAEQGIGRITNLFHHAQVASNGGESQLTPGVDADAVVHNPNGVPIASTRRATSQEMSSNEGDSDAK